MYSVLSSVRRAGLVCVRRAAFPQRVRYNSHFTMIGAEPNEFYLEMQRQDLRPLNDYLKNRKRSFEDRLCCCKPSHMKVETAVSPMYKCPRDICRT